MYVRGVWDAPVRRLLACPESGGAPIEVILTKMTPRLTALLAPALLLLTGGLSGAHAQSGSAAGLPLQKGHTNAVLEGGWSPDDKLLLTYSAGDGYLGVWEMPGGRLRWRVQDLRSVKDKGDERHALRAFAWSDDGRLIATGSENGTAQVWDAATGRMVWKSRVAAEYVAGVAFSHDGKLVAAAAVGLAKFEAGGPAGRGRELRPHPRVQPRRAPDRDLGHQRGMYVWDARSGRPLRELDGGYSSDDAIAFSPDGKRLASGGGNQNIIMWDARTGGRLWQALPVEGRYRPAPEEEAEQKHEAERAAAEAKRTEQEVASPAPNVFVTFDHYGAPTDARETRIAETGKPDKSLTRQNREDATGVWLRLHNDSPLPVSISTESVYLPGAVRCGFQTERRFYYGLCEGAEVGIRVGVRDARGKPLPYGFDFGGISMVPPKTSVLFSLPRALLKEGRSVVVHFRFMKESAKGKLEDYGEGCEFKFTESLLK